MDDERRRHRNTGKNIQTSLTHDIYNNPHVTWGRTDYISGDITGDTWDIIKTTRLTLTELIMTGKQEGPYMGEETKAEEDKV